MKLFTKKNVIQKMMIVLVFLILFNFISPCYVRAETAIEAAGKKIFTPVRGLLVLCCDGFMNTFQYWFLTNEKAVIDGSDILEQNRDFLGEDGKENHGNLFFNDYGKDNFLSELIKDTAINLDNYWTDIANFKYTPQTIFEGRVNAFNINFIGSKQQLKNEDSSNTSQENTNNPDMNKKEEGFMVAYTTAVNGLKKDIIDAYNESNEAKALAGIQIIYYFGISKTGLNSAEAVEAIQVPTNIETVKSYVARLSNQYQGGQNIYGIFGINKDKADEISKYGMQLIDSNNIVGLLGMYYTDIGGGKITYTSGDPLNYDELTPTIVLHDMIASWYKIMRNIAVVFLLSVLVYIGIRIMISSTAADNAKYKKMLVDWVIALCILFAIHYIMAFVSGTIDFVTDALSGGVKDASWTDGMFANVRNKVQSESLYDQATYTVFYLVLVIFTGMFTVYYVKRVIYAAFLTLIAPLVALTYPMDKIGDGKSQAFNFWLKEYIANAIIQPIHLLLYTVLISSVPSLAETNPLYGVVLMGAMVPVEKFIREMFGFNSQKGPGPLGGIAGGALALNAFGKLMGNKPPKMPKPDVNKEMEKKPRTNDVVKDASTSKYGTYIKDMTANNPVTAGGGVPSGNIRTATNPGGGTAFGSSQGTVPSFGSGTTTGSSQGTTSSFGGGATFGPSQGTIPSFGNGTTTGSSQGTTSSFGGGATFGPSQGIIPSFGSGTTTGSSQGTTSSFGGGSTFGQSQGTIPSFGSGTTTGSSQGTTSSFGGGSTFGPSQGTIPSMGSATTGTRQNNPLTHLGIGGNGGVPKRIKKPKKQLSTEQLAKKRAKYAQKEYKRKYYADINKKQARKVVGGLAGGLIKGVTTAAGVMAGATVAAAATVASGDANKFVPNMATGILAGSKGGQALGDSIAGTAGSFIDGVSNSIDVQKAMKQEYEDVRRREDPKYKEKQENKENQKKSHSHKTREALKAHYGHLDSEELKKKQDKIKEIMDFGVKDVNNAMRVMDLVDEGKMTEYEAKWAGLQASRIPKGDLGQRANVRNEMVGKMSKELMRQSGGTMSSEEAIAKAEEVANRTMYNMDIFNNEKQEDWGRPEEEAKIRKQQQEEEERKKVYENELIAEMARIEAQRQASAQQPLSPQQNP